MAGIDKKNFGSIRKIVGGEDNFFSPGFSDSGGH